MDDVDFDLRRHVHAMGSDEEPLSRAQFVALSDAVLSEPLDRSRPLWRIHVAPWLDDGTVGLVLKAHHAMVDGLSALALGLLLLDVRPDALGPEVEPPEWTPEPPPGTVRLAVDALADYGAESLRAARGITRAIGTGRRIGDTVRRTALAIEADVLRAAPSSYLNQSIGPARRLAGHNAPIEDLLAVRAARGTTLNDAALAVVTGALRRLALSRGTVPAPLKAMVPVNRRTAAEGGAPGNRIAFVSVTLPLNVRAPLRRLDEIAAQTRAFKADGRASGSETLLGALGAAPADPAEPGRALRRLGPRLQPRRLQRARAAHAGLPARRALHRGLPGYPAVRRARALDRDALPLGRAVPSAPTGTPRRCPRAARSRRPWPNRPSSSRARHPAVRHGPRERALRSVSRSSRSRTLGPARSDRTHPRVVSTPDRGRRAIHRARSAAAAGRSPSGTTADTTPRRKASGASRIRPVSDSSAATARESARRAAP